MGLGSMQTRRVEIGYDFSKKPYNSIKSEREYAMVEIQMIHRKVYDYSYRSEDVSVANREAYIDPETGIMVFDVGQYESFLRHNNLKVESDVNADSEDS